MFSIYFYDDLLRALITPTYPQLYPWIEVSGCPSVLPEHIISIIIVVNCGKWCLLKTSGCNEEVSILIHSFLSHIKMRMNEPIVAFRCKICLQKRFSDWIPHDKRETLPVHRLFFAIISDIVDYGTASQAIKCSLSPCFHYVCTYRCNQFLLVPLCSNLILPYGLLPSIHTYILQNRSVRCALGVKCLSLKTNIRCGLYKIMPRKNVCSANFFLFL